MATCSAGSLLRAVPCSPVRILPVRSSSCFSSCSPFSSSSFRLPGGLFLRSLPGMVSALWLSGTLSSLTASCVRPVPEFSSVACPSPPACPFAGWLLFAVFHQSFLRDPRLQGLDLFGLFRAVAFEDLVPLCCLFLGQGIARLGAAVSFPFGPRSSGCVCVCVCVHSEI